MFSPAWSPAWSTDCSRFLISDAKWSALLLSRHWDFRLRIKLVHDTMKEVLNPCRRMTWSLLSALSAGQSCPAEDLCLQLILLLHEIRSVQHVSLPPTSQKNCGSDHFTYVRLWQFRWSGPTSTVPDIQQPSSNHFLQITFTCAFT